MTHLFKTELVIPPGLLLDRLATNILIEEVGDTRVSSDAIGELSQSVTLVAEQQILDGAAALAQRRRHLIGLRLRHARVVGALHENQRRYDPIHMGER